MSHADSPIDQFMTAAPRTIRPTASLSEARRYLQNHGMRHLPVEGDGRLLGIVTERDLYVISLFPEVSFATAHVSFAMESNLYCVTPKTTLREVASGMAERRIGSALVVDGGKLVGIFTEADALKILAYA